MQLTIIPKRHKNREKLITRKTWGYITLLIIFLAIWIFVRVATIYWLIPYQEKLRKIEQKERELTEEYQALWREYLNANSLKYMADVGEQWGFDEPMEVIYLLPNSNLTVRM